MIININRLEFILYGRIMKELIPLMYYYVNYILDKKSFKNG